MKLLPMADRLPLQIENVDTATFKCVFPICGGVCCKNGRPPLERDERNNIGAHLDRFLPLLRDGARAHVRKHGWLTRRVKDGKRTVAVQGGWCVFANDGCVLQKVGIAEGKPWKYKPSICVSFPLEKTQGGSWYIRQWNHRGEIWDLFCLNPKEDPTPARISLREEIEFSARRERKRR